MRRPTASSSARPDDPEDPGDRRDPDAVGVPGGRDGPSPDRDGPSRDRSRSGRSRSTTARRSPSLTVAYRHDGPAPGTAPQVLVVHALTGSADAAGDWWAPLIGPGRALDTERIGVLCRQPARRPLRHDRPDLARSARPGRPYGAAFPAVSTRDQARAQWRLLDALGVDRARSRRRRLARRHGRPRGRADPAGRGPDGDADRGAGRDRPDGRSPGTTSRSSSSSGSASTAWRSPASWR